MPRRINRCIFPSDLRYLNRISLVAQGELFTFRQFILPAVHPRVPFKTSQVRSGAGKVSGGEGYIEGAVAFVKTSSKPHAQTVHYYYPGRCTLDNNLTDTWGIGSILMVPMIPQLWVGTL
eukprot:scaffold159179_cov53-Attheya_sp.AAC.1